MLYLIFFLQGTTAHAHCSLTNLCQIRTRISPAERVLVLLITLSPAVTAQVTGTLDPRYTVWVLQKLHLENYYFYKSSMNSKVSQIIWFNFVMVCVHAWMNRRHCLRECTTRLDTHGIPFSSFIVTFLSLRFIPAAFARGASAVITRAGARAIRGAIGLQTAGLG